MDGVDLVPLLQKLEENIDDLEETLEPLLQSKLSDVAKASPLLDKAKLHVLITYSIESLLFSYLRLHGVNAREHPVFTELTRLQQYFAKIDAAEKGPTKRENMSLNVPAVDRILKHNLAGNEKYDLERAEQQAKQRAAAQLKLRRITKKRKAPASDDENEGAESSAKVAESTDQTDANSTEGVPNPAVSESRRSKKKQRHAVKKAKKAERERLANED